MAGWFTAAGSEGATPKRMKLMVEDLAEKRASSGKRSHELTTKLAEQRDDAVRLLEEEWHQHAQSHPESSKPPEAPQLPQPSHELDEAAASLYPFLQRRLEEFKAEAAKREEMLAGLDKYLFKYIIKGADSASAAPAPLAPTEDASRDEGRPAPPPSAPPPAETRRLARTKRSVLDDIQRGRVSLARPVLRRHLDARRQQLNDGTSMMPGSGPKPPGITQRLPQGYVGISYESADDEKEDEDESEEEEGHGGAITANGATAAKAATATKAAQAVEDEGSRRVRIDKMRALHGPCPYWYP